MSPDLIAFLKAWHDWATNGAPEGEPFWRSAGLCGSAEEWRDSSLSLYMELRDRLGGAEYPFGERDYSHRWAYRTQHECPKRLAWVRERLIEAGELVA